MVTLRPKVEACAARIASLSVTGLVVAATTWMMFGDGRMQGLQGKASFPGSEILLVGPLAAYCLWIMRLAWKPRRGAWCALVAITCVLPFAGLPVGFRVGENEDRPGLERHREALVEWIIEFRARHGSLPASADEIGRDRLDYRRLGLRIPVSYTPPDEDYSWAILEYEWPEGNYWCHIAPSDGARPEWIRRSGSF